MPTVEEGATILGDHIDDLFAQGIISSDQHRHLEFQLNRMQNMIEALKYTNPNNLQNNQTGDYNIEMCFNGLDLSDDFDSQHDEVADLFKFILTSINKPEPGFSIIKDDSSVSWHTENIYHEFNVDSDIEYSLSASLRVSFVAAELLSVAAAT